MAPRSATRLHSSRRNHSTCESLIFTGCIAHDVPYLHRHRFYSQVKSSILTRYMGVAWKGTLLGSDGCSTLSKVAAC